MNPAGFDARYGDSYNAQQQSAPSAVQPTTSVPVQTTPMSSGLSPQRQQIFRQIANPHENAALDVVLQYNLGQPMEPIQKSDLVGTNGTNLLKSRSPVVRDSAQTWFDLANSFVGQSVPAEFHEELQEALLISTLGYSKFPRADADIRVIPSGISYVHSDGTVRKRPGQRKQSQLSDYRTGLEGGLTGPFVTGGGTVSAF